MSKLQMKNLLNILRSSGEQELTIELNQKSSESLEKTRLFLSQLERLVRIQKLELAVKRLNIQRSLL
jgi:hypothetical protein